MQRRTFNSRRRGGGSRFGSSGASSASSSSSSIKRTGFVNRSRPGSRSSRPTTMRKTEKIDFSRFINKANISIEPEIYVPENRFSDFKVLEELKKSITKKGYDVPTPIQDKAIPELLKGRDVVGLANTGTGKTAAFLIPLINKVLLNKKEQVMVVVPTRELAFQIDEELKQLVRGMKIFSVCTVGGAPIQKQLSQLKFQYNFIIGTPGRIKDFIERRVIRLNEFNSIVLDEADRMLDMGFVADMRAIMNGMPDTKQTLFFSATINRDIDKLILEFLKDPIRISVKTQDTAQNIEQEVFYVDRMKGRIATLHDMLIKDEFKKVLIFGRTKHGVEKLYRELVKRGFKAESIHGDKTYGQRLKALQLFKDGHSKILVATDIAARGLDIPDVTHVINFDMPATNDDYIHRIGRTGRGAKRGKAITLVEL